MEEKNYAEIIGQSVLARTHREMNCTVVYLDKCMSHKQCSRQCLVGVFNLFYFLNELIGLFVN